MKYKLIKDIFETSFDEFFPGKCEDGRRPYNENSVYLNSVAMGLISDCLHRANNGYGGFDKNTVFTKGKGQIWLLAEELRNRLMEIINDKDFSGKSEPDKINDLKENKTDIIKMIKDLIDWIENLKENELTVIPDTVAMFRTVLGGI